MSNFKEFVKRSSTEPLEIGNDFSNQLLSLPEITKKLPGQLMGITSSLIGSGIFKKETDQEKLANEIAAYSTSDEFLDKVSKKIGAPLVNESEDEFVKRASESMKKILRHKFDGK